MALDSQALTTTCNAGMGPDVEDRDQKPEPPPTTASGTEEEAVVYKKGAWSKEEDEKLIRAVEEYGLRNWVTIEKFSGLARPAKNCRLRWLNYLRPNLKKFPFTEEEERLIIHLHAKHGNSWSRIAAKLPGRSDNEIKNFWHKRAKKRQKQHLPLYPTRQELQQYQTNDSPYNAKTNADYTFDDYTTNYHPNIQTLNINSPDSQKTSAFQPTHVPSTPSSSTYSPRTPIPTPKSQFQLSPSSSTYSPQTPIPTPQSQVLSSPSSIITSQKQSPTNDQTPLLSSTTPMSRPQSSLLSPHQSTEIPLWQGSNDFTMLRKPPILSSPDAPLRRFSRATSHQLPPRANSVHGQSNPIVGASSAFPPPQDSSLQMQWPSPVGSPRSPMKLKLSPGVPPVYSLQVSSQRIDSQVSSFSVFQANTAPLSPLKLGTSTQESCSQSNSIPEYAVQLNSSIAAEPMSVGIESQPPLIQVYQQASAGANSSAHEAESDSNLEIMDELREAQERVKFLKRKLRQNKISKKRSLLTGSSTDLYRLCQMQLGENSETGKHTSGIIKSQNIAQCENSETNTSPPEEASQGKIFKLEDSMKESQSGDLFDHINSHNTVKAPDSDSWGNKVFPTQGSAANCLNECATMEELLSESSTLLQGDLFGQSSGLENPLSSSAHVALIDAFGPIYSQSTATTLVKPVDEEFGLGQEISYEQNLLTNQYPAAASNMQDSSYLLSKPIMEHESPVDQQFSHQTSGSGNSAESQLCETSLLQHQYPAANMLDSRYLYSKQIMEQESSGGQQFYLQNSGGGNSAETSNHCETTFLLHQSPVMDSKYSTNELPRCGVGTGPTFTETWRQESGPEQSLMNSLLTGSLWTGEQMVSQDQTFSTQRSDCDQTEVLRQEQEHKYINAISNDDISSLLEFLPTTDQTLEWHSIGNATPGAESDDELGLHMSSTSQPPITIADYLN